jgi:hypothetical protein
MDSDQMEEYHKDIEQSVEQKNIDIANMISLDEFNLGNLEEGSQFLKEDITHLEKIIFYYMRLHKPKSFPNEDNEWDELLIMTDDDSPDLLRTHKSRGLYDRWLINYRDCKLALIYWRKIAKSFPLFYLDWSQNSMLNKSDLIRKLTKESNGYMQLRVDEVWMNYIVSEPESLRKNKNYFQEKSKQLEQDISRIVQDLSETSVIFGDYLEGYITQKFKKQVSKYKTRSYIALAALGALIVVFGLILSFIL